MPVPFCRGAVAVNVSPGRVLFVAAFLALPVVSIDVGRHHAAAAAESGGIENLKKTLAEVLRARRPEEFAFLNRVVELVEDGDLPRSMVESTFNWARKKPRHPFQYFEQALRIRAKRIGVEI
jgi:hypothetical protein